MDTNTQRKTKRGRSICLWEQDLEDDSRGTRRGLLFFVAAVVVFVSLLVPLNMFPKILKIKNKY